MGRAPATAALLVLVVLAAGCRSQQGIEGGGRVAGDTLTVYSSLPEPGRGTSRDLVDGEKLALSEAGARAGDYKISFASIDERALGAADAGVRAADAARTAIADPQIIAMIGPARSETGMVSVPLLDAAGILQLAPGAGYAGFTEPAAPGEPDRWQPSGRGTFRRLVGSDRSQAAALLAAARVAAGTAGPPRVAIEQEAGPVADALVDSLQREASGGAARLAGDPARADAVVYAGEDVVNAAGVADALSREAPGAAVILPDALTRAGVAQRLPRGARRRAVLVSGAPEPGSTPQLRAFADRFEAALGRPPGPYATIGYTAMRDILAAIRKAGGRAGLRQAVINAYAGAPPGGFTAFRPRGAGRRAYLDLG